MEISEKTQRVWERVQGKSQPKTDEGQLRELIAQALTAATVYLQLSRRSSGRESILLRRMFEEEQAHAACLKGIFRMITGQRPDVHIVPQTPEEPALALRRCYGREMRCLAQFEAKAADPEYGPVFSRLAQREREHCHNILTLMGMLEAR